MKSVLGISLMAFLLLNCAPSGQVMRPPAENVIDLSQKGDDDEYDLIVLDPGFDNWFATTWNAAKDRSVEYYSNWNYQYVSAWNYKATRPHYSEFFDTIITYDASIDYGIQLGIQTSHFQVNPYQILIILAHCTLP